MNNILLNISDFIGPCGLHSDYNLANKQSFKATNGHSKKQLDKVNPRISVICFSKERPYQLYQLLCSMSFYSPEFFIDSVISVVCCFGTYQFQYETIFSKFSNVNVIDESDFYEDILHCIQSMQDQGFTHIMFCVDDMIFISPWNIRWNMIFNLYSCWVRLDLAKIWYL